MDVLDSVKLLLYISGAFGVAPFKYKNKTLKESRRVSCYSAIITAAITILLMIFSANNVSYHSATFLRGLMSASHWVTVSTNSLLTVIILRRHKDVLRESLVKLNEFQVFQTRIRGRQLKSLKMLTIACSLGAVSHWLLFVLVYQEETGKRKFFLPYPGFRVVSYFGMYIGVLMMYTWCVQFVVYTSIIRHCFKVANEKFSDVMKRCGGLSRNPPCDRLACLITTHDFLVDITEDMASIFSVYFLAITILVFVETVYTFTHYLTVKSAWLGSFVWLSFYLFQFAGVVGAAVATTSQAEKTANYLHELFIDNDDPELKEEIEIFSLQLLHRKVEFNACGFFKLDFSLLYSMVGAVTTYIIILMQFQGNNATSYGNCTTVKCSNCTMSS